MFGVAMQFFVNMEIERYTLVAMGITIVVLGVCSIVGVKFGNCSRRRR